MKALALLLTLALCGVEGVEQQPIKQSIFSTYEDFLTDHGKIDTVESRQTYNENIIELESRTSPGCSYASTFWLDVPKSKIDTVFSSTFEPPESGTYLQPQQGATLLDILQDFKDFVTRNQDDDSSSDPSTSPYSDGFDWSIPSLNPSNADIVTKPRNQGLCGSCYAFSSLGSLETTLAISTEVPVTPLSVEEVVDCSTNNLGCTGGNPLLAMEWVSKHGVGLEKDYRYASEGRGAGEENECKMNHGKTSRAFVDQYAIVQPTVRGIKEALKYSTVAVGIDGTEVGLLGYRSGVYGDRPEEVAACTDKPLNHAVLIVGWGIDSKGEYWRVRNSWGDQWGEKGFFRVRILEGDGVCGINKNPSVVLSAKYSDSPATMSLSSELESGIGVQYICAVALAVMAVVSLILWCGCGDKEESPRSQSYLKSPAFFYGAVERRERLEKTKSNLAKASPRWLGGGLGVYQNIASTPPDSRGGTPTTFQGRRGRGGSEDEERGLLQKPRASSFGHLDQPDLTRGPASDALGAAMGATKKKKKKKKKKVNMGIGIVPGGLRGKGFIDCNVSVDKSPPGQNKF